MVLSILAIALALSPAAVADTLVGSAGYGWQGWDVADLNEDGTPYWDRKSRDGSNRNIGHCLTGTGNCTTTNYPAWTDRPGNIPYWGSATGTADSSWYMQRSGTGNQTALKIEIAGNRNINTFGWYDIDNKSGYASNVIFEGLDGAGAAEFYAPSANYGFWFRGSQGTYFTQGGGNQFAIFKQSEGAYWLGMEDLHSNSDWDYNDMVVKITAVPDGGMTLMLLGGALLGLETLRRKVRS
jgi:hypothetical protein